MPGSQDHRLQILRNHSEMVPWINLTFVVLDHLNPLLLAQSSHSQFLLAHLAIFLVLNVLTQVESFSNVIARPIKLFLQRFSHFLLIYISGL